MPTINQIRANRRNAKKSTGPKTSAGKEHSRFNALLHGLRAESAVIPGEDRSKFDLLLERLIKAWMPQDDMETSLVEQIAVTQWKLARLDRAEARIYGEEVKGADFALAIHRVYLTQTRLERAISTTIADLERYRKQRLDRKDDAKPKKEDQIYRGGLIWYNNEGKGHYAVLPEVRGLDGKWRYIPAEVLADYPDPSHPPEPGPPNTA